MLDAVVSAGTLDGVAVAGELEQPTRITLSTQSSVKDRVERLMRVIFMRRFTSYWNGKCREA